MLTINTVSPLWPLMCMGALLRFDDDDSSNFLGLFPRAYNKQSFLLQMFKYDQVILFHL